MPHCKRFAACARASRALLVTAISFLPQQCPEHAYDGNMQSGSQIVVEPNGQGTRAEQSRLLKNGAAAQTTQGYIDLAGETFREEAELADARLFGVGQKSGQK
jgi:hypothetical protein